MFVWVFQGNLGEGKTFGMSVFAHYYAARARRAGIKVDLYANYDLQGSYHIRDYKDFYKVAKSESSIILLDEAHVNLDSRLFSRGMNIYMTQFMFYLRKLNSSLFMTTPHIKNLDSRMRQLTNILVDCHRLPSGFMYDIYDFQGERLLRRKFLPKYMANQIFDIGIYDTHSIVRAIEFPSTDRTFGKFLDNIIKIRDEDEEDKEDSNDDEYS